MSWAAYAERELQAGREVRVRPRGHSMTPRIRSGQEVLLRPIADPASIQKDDVVLVRMAGRHLLHKVKAVTAERVLISRQDGRENGWLPRSKVIGRAVL